MEKPKRFLAIQRSKIFSLVQFAGNLDWKILDGKTGRRDVFAIHAHPRVAEAPLRVFVTEAVEEKLAATANKEQKPGFGWRVV